MSASEDFTDPAEQARLVARLQSASACAWPAQSIELLQTHISYVLLAGDYAYKIKKALDLGFLDFRSLASRRRFCDEELRLNRRTAPEIYIDVVDITGTVDDPRIGGTGTPLEHAVRMHRFASDATLDKLRGSITPGVIDALADAMVEFHRSIAIARPGDGYGTPELVARPARDNIVQMHSLVRSPQDRAVLEEHGLWLERRIDALREAFQSRLDRGCVRECHGDLHLGNIAWIDNRPLFFDCIEFDPRLRWIDVINELAFLAMDLQSIGRPAFAWRLINRYLEATGDYDGVAVLRYYLAYRAMVRAKVGFIQASQPTGSGAAESARAHLRLAAGYAADAAPALVLTHGLSGSGKSTFAQELCELGGAIRLRSDVERKRMYGLAAEVHRGDAIADGLYASEATRATYRRLCELARIGLRAGHRVIVDAACLARWQRDLLRGVADECGAACAILDLAADRETLRERIARRHADGSDASDADLAVLEHQLRTHEHLDEDEQCLTLTWDATQPVDADAIATLWRNLSALVERRTRLE